MDVRMVNLEGKDVGTKPALTAWERRAVSPKVLHQVAVAALTNQRVARAHTKDRGERRGGGRKPWRQKGTGRARHGSIRSPLWRKGGVTFGPRAERTYAARTSSSMRRTALAGALVGKIRDGEFLLLERLPELSGKTRELHRALAKLPFQGVTLLLIPGTQGERDVFRRAGRNLPYVRMGNPVTVPVADILQHTMVVTTPAGLELLEGRVTQPSAAGD